eukprot:Em0010g217a
MASQAQKHSGGQTSDDVKSLRTKVRQMEERIIELEKAVERIDVLEERLAQISLSHGTLQNEDRSDGASKGAECTGAKAVIPLATLQDVMHQYSDQLPLIEKKWSDLSEDLKAQLVSSLVGNLKFNKIPVPQEQLIRKRLKDYYASRRNTVLTKANICSDQFARDKAVKDAIEAGEVDAKDIESIKKVRAAVPTVPLPETLAPARMMKKKKNVQFIKRKGC